MNCKHITFVVTKKCNANCVGCYIYKQNEELDVRILKMQLIHLVELGGKTVGFSGGEPLLYSSIYEAIDMAKKLGLKTSMVTNGILLSDSVAQKLHKSGLDYIQISLDSHDSMENDRLRGAGMYDTVVYKAIPAAKKNGLNITMVAVPNKHLISNICDYLSFVNKIGVNKVYFRRKIESEDDIAKDFDRKEYRQFLYSLLDYQSSSPIKIISGDPLFTALVASRRTIEYEKLYAGCSAGVTSLAIQPNGDVYPCTRFPLVIGNIKTESLLNIWKENRILKSLQRRELKGACGECNYKYVCGGCRAMAYINHSDFAAEDDMCVLKK